MGSIVDESAEPRVWKFRLPGWPGFLVQHTLFEQEGGA
jgi:hypothetical protein